ncbi:MAG TPA: hypothetical protein VJN69_10390 [Candidatus Acidoferrales bacterium]|nr:hypothetical protein [Candidatus Acidoferrales bacterium]
MYSKTLVEDVAIVVDLLRQQNGELSLAMLYNEGPLQTRSNWNLIVSASWIDSVGTAEATRRIAKLLGEMLDAQSKLAISRITALKTSDPFVQDMTRLYQVSGPTAFPLATVTAGSIDEGSAFVLYSAPTNSMIPG